MPHIDETKTFKPLSIAILTVSDTRTEDNDTSGGYLKEALIEAGHKLAGYAIIHDSIPLLRNQVQNWVVDDAIDVVITTGGTGLTGRDVTPEALKPLFNKEIEGFSTTFHMISYESVGTSTIQSRACAGIADKTLIFCVPGSTGACKDAWNGILKFQLDSRHQPCNFVEIIPRLKE